MSAAAIYEELLENCYAKTYKNIFYLENFWKIIRHFALFSSIHFCFVKIWQALTKNLQKTVIWRKSENAIFIPLFFYEAKLKIVFCKVSILPHQEPCYCFHSPTN